MKLAKLQQGLASLQQRFEALPPNDRRALTLLMLFLVSTIAWLLLSGTRDYQQAAIARYEAALTDARWIHLNRQLLAGLPTAKPAATPVDGSTDNSLISVASASAKPHGISFKRFQPEGETVLRLWIEGARFDDLLRWIDNLAITHHVALEQLDVERVEKQAGFVDARVTISREP